MPSIKIKNYIDCYNKVNKTNYHTVLQIPRQNIQVEDLRNLRYTPTTVSKNKHSKIEILKKIYQWIKQTRTNLKLFGVGQSDLIKSFIHSSPIASTAALFGKIKSQTTLATIPIKKRNSSKAINATLEKLEFEEGSISYVLKHKGKQLGHLDIKEEAKEVYIDFMTNILGRKKYRNIENILLQGMIEDCMKQGFVPRLKAVAANVGEHMGQGYNNRSLYKRMGMETDSEGYMRISAEKLSEIIAKRQEKFGRIID